MKKQNNYSIIRQAETTTAWFTLCDEFHFVNYLNPFVDDKEKEQSFLQSAFIFAHSAIAKKLSHTNGKDWVMWAEADVTLSKYYYDCVVGKKGEEYIMNECAKIINLEYCTLANVSSFADAYTLEELHSFAGLLGLPRCSHHAEYYHLFYDIVNNVNVVEVVAKHYVMGADGKKHLQECIEEEATLASKIMSIYRDGIINDTIDGIGADIMNVAVSAMYCAKKADSFYRCVYDIRTDADIVKSVFHDVHNYIYKWKKADMQKDEHSLYGADNDDIDYDVKLGTRATRSFTDSTYNKVERNLAIQQMIDALETSNRRASVKHNYKVLLLAIMHDCYDENDYLMKMLGIKSDVNLRKIKSRFKADYGRIVEALIAFA